MDECRASHPSVPKRPRNPERAKFNCNRPDRSFVGENAGTNALELSRRRLCHGSIPPTQIDPIVWSVCHEVSPGARTRAKPLSNRKYRMPLFTTLYQIPEATRGLNDIRLAWELLGETSGGIPTTRESPEEGGLM